MKSECDFYLFGGGQRRLCHQMRDGNEKLGKRQTLGMCLKITPVSPFSVLIISPPLVSCLQAELGIFLPASPGAPDTWFVALFKASTRQRREWQLRTGREFGSVVNSPTAVSRTPIP